MTTTTGDHTTAISTGELLTLDQYRTEGNAAEAGLERLTALASIFVNWANGLPERYMSADFGTNEISLGVSHVAEAKGNAEAITEAIAEIITGLNEADAITAKNTELAAVGKVDAFKTN